MTGGGRGAGGSVSGRGFEGSVSAHRLCGCVCGSFQPPLLPAQPSGSEASTRRVCSLLVPRASHVQFPLRRIGTASPSSPSPSRSLQTPTPQWKSRLPILGSNASSEDSSDYTCKAASRSGVLRALACHYSNLGILPCFPPTACWLALSECFRARTRGWCWTAVLGFHQDPHCAAQETEARRSVICSRLVNRTQVRPTSKSELLPAK